MVVKLKKTELFEINEAYQKVLFWFFSFPNKEFSLNDLASRLKIAKSTAREVVKMLVGEDFLKIETISRLWRISCNQNHPYNYSRKISYNLMMVYESGIIQEIHKHVPNPKAVILFGSYRKGDDIDKSDIDIAVEIIGNQQMQIKQIGVFPKLGFRENIPVNLHIFSRKKIDINLFSNIANGILLEGFLEARP